uniref:Uncharacterized protein n=1 Tax=Rhizophora mucronata TaxID=61149 RepID=A0A2P2MSD9_RHIMU
MYVCIYLSLYLSIYLSVYLPTYASVLVGARVYDDDEKKGEDEPPGREGNSRFTTTPTYRRRSDKKWMVRIDSEDPNYSVGSNFLAPLVQRPFFKF